MVLENAQGLVYLERNNITTKWRQRIIDMKYSVVLIITRLVIRPSIGTVQFCLTMLRFRPILCEERYVGRDLGPTHYSRLLGLCCWPNRFQRALWLG